MRSRHVSLVIHASPEHVYEVAADADRLPQWASGLSPAPRRDGPDLLIGSPIGDIRVRFAPRNRWGVLDYTVRMPTGEIVDNPMRVIAHPDGAEVIATVRQLDGDEAQLDADAAAVLADLERLKALAERR